MDVSFPVHTSTVTTLVPQPQDVLKPELLLVEGGTEAMVSLYLTSPRDTPWGQLGTAYSNTPHGSCVS